jgi:pentatricopeptide repeat protein
VCFVAVDWVCFLPSFTIAGISPDIYTYNAVLKAWLKLGKVDNAMATFAEMQSVGLKPDHISYTTLMALLLRVRYG